MSDATPLTPHNLLQGAFFALEQAWNLLHDAVLLYENRRWATAAGIAVMSIEEIGKCRILIENLQKVFHSEIVTRPMLRAAFRKHEHKLRYGLSNVSNIVSVWDWGPTPESPELDSLYQELKRAQQVERESAPERTHQERMQAIYVDLTEDLNWLRPLETSRQHAHWLLLKACVEYHLARERFMNPKEREEQVLLAPIRHWPLPEIPVLKS